jgi:nucleotide-binding universal stress UspA family protein
VSNFNKILCALDFDKNCETLVGVARRLCEGNRGQLHLLHVARVPPPDQDVPLPLADDPRWEEIARKHLEAIAHKVLDGSVPWELHVSSGVPERDIVHMADRLSIDLIVMGTHGRTGISHLVLGSVAEEVIRKANCAVLTLRTGRALLQAATDSGG